LYKADSADSPTTTEIDLKKTFSNATIFSITCYYYFMATASQKTSTRKSSPIRKQILDMRGGLLALHKALILAEQVTYERINGRVKSTSELLQLVLNDPWFTWLHPISQLIVRIDELLDDKSELSLVELEHFLIEARSLLRPSEHGDGFERSYYEALQREPDVIFAHVEVKRLLTKIAA
jgi:hypothetical protein